MTHPSDGRPVRWRPALAVAQLGALLAFWLILSGKLEPLFVLMGLASAAAVTALTHPILVVVMADPPARRGHRLRRAGWLVVFVVWLLWSIIVASLQVALFVVHPRRAFRPRFVMFETELERPVSRVVLALAITVVPGTMTVRLVGNRYLVHSLITGSAADLASGRTQSLIARVTGEGPQPPPTMRWGPVLDTRRHPR